MKYSIRTVIALILAIILVAVVKVGNDNTEVKNLYEMNQEITMVKSAYADTIENLGKDGGEPLRSAIIACNVGDSTRTITWEGGLKECPARDIVNPVVAANIAERDSAIASIKADYAK